MDKIKPSILTDVPNYLSMLVSNAVPTEASSTSTPPATHEDKALGELNLCVVTGEASGDMHAANLIKELSKNYSVRLFGTGGVKLKEVGQTQLATINELSVIGFAEAFIKIPKLLSLAKKLISECKSDPVDAVILVDYAGFNLRFAKKLKKNLPHVPIICLIAPQVWIWNYSRVKALRDYFDNVLCILPFEEKILRDEKINANYIGHPVVDSLINKYSDKDEFIKQYNLDNNKLTIGIVPGSRANEVALILPIVNDAINLLKTKGLTHNLQFVLAQANSISDEMIQKHLDKAHGTTIIQDNSADILKHSDLLWICSGTATLEATMFKTPMIIMYNASWLNFFIIQRLTSLRMVGMPNIISSQMNYSAQNAPIVPELLSKYFTAESLVDTHINMLENLSEYAVKLDRVRQLFLNMSPLNNAALEIMKTVRSCKTQDSQ